ncbi:MAG: diphosphomevalonate decarboxylase [Anaerolineae bacterium]|nr:diphosphomevalonate decarboxylase [Anaerolineae bacterium]
MEATARAHPNIAFIKYWGNRDDHLRIPANSSISMNLDGLSTETTVEWADDIAADYLILNGTAQTGPALERVQRHLDMLRRRLNLSAYARVESTNNFPMGAGIASSASSFAALTVAGVAASGRGDIDERELTRLARLGSGSASRSVPGGFVEWHSGDSHETSYAESMAPENHWALVDVIAVISTAHKAVGSTEGHKSASTSVLQTARVADAALRFEQCKRAILDRDFVTFAEVVERDSNLMHAIMMTSRPPLFYWLPGSLEVMESVRSWRSEGLDVCYTMDAGPNVHCICTQERAAEIETRLRQMTYVVDVRTAGVGGAASVVRVSKR